MEKLVRTLIIMGILTLFILIIVIALFNNVTGGRCGKDCECRGGECKNYNCPAGTQKDLLAECPGGVSMVCCVPTEQQP